MQVDYIYALFFTLDDKKDYFYVGRSENPTRRMKEHRSNSKSGATEDSREFIRNLWTVGLDFDHEILATITSDQQNYEDFYVWDLARQGYQLTNMKQGDSIRQAEENIGFCFTPEEFLQKRAEAIQQAIPKEVKAKRESVCDPNKVLYSFEKPERRFVAPAMREMIARRAKKIV